MRVIRHQNSTQSHWRRNLRPWRSSKFYWVRKAMSNLTCSWFEQRIDLETPQIPLLSCVILQTFDSKYPEFWFQHPPPYQCHQNHQLHLSLQGDIAGAVLLFFVLSTERVVCQAHLCYLLLSIASFHELSLSLYEIVLSLGQGCHSYPCFSSANCIAVLAGANINNKQI